MEWMTPFFFYFLFFDIKMTVKFIFYGTQVKLSSRWNNLCLLKLSQI